MERENITFVTHAACGQQVTWQLGTLEREGGPYCSRCGRAVTREELSQASRPLCVTDEIFDDLADTVRPSRRW